MDLIETDNEEENFIGTPAAAETTNNLLPEKSRYQYERAYNIFDEWRKENRIRSFLCQNMKPRSLWSTYSMVRSTINLKNYVDIST
jgi:hypothetical protein